jgi:hypothetical protein
VQLIVTYSGSTTAAGVKVYFDSKEYITKTITTNNLSATCANSESLILGSNNSYYSDHKQSITRLYSRVITNEEIISLYNRGTATYNNIFSNCVLEMKIKNDVFASNFTVIESAENNNGVSAGMLLSAKVIVANMDGMIAPVQNYTGSSLYYETYASAGNESTSAVMHSPFSDKLRTPIVYDSATGNTYVGWQQSPKLGYNRRSRLLCIQHLAKTVTPSGYANYLVPGVTETHSAPAVTITPSGEVLLVHEEEHNSPIYVERTVNKNIGSMDTLYTIPKYLSYPNLQVLGGNVFLQVRGSTINDATIFENAKLYKSTDNGSTWDNGVTICNTNISVGYFERPYCLSVYSKTKLVFMFTMRNDSANSFSHNYYVESLDGVTFTNKSGSFSKNVVSSGYITRAELDANYLAYTNSGTDVMCKAAVITGSGLSVSVHNYLNSGYKVLYYSGGTWQTKTLNIPAYVAAGHDSAYRADFMVLYPYSDTRFVLWRIEKRSGYNVVVKYETTDFFDTIDAGTVVSSATMNHEQMQGTFNINDASNIVITANQLGSSYNNLFIYEFTP